MTLKRVFSGLIIEHPFYFMSKVEIILPTGKISDSPAIYKFTTDNGFFYIGGTKRMRNRIGQHKKHFHNGTHAENVVRALSGCLSITFEIIERVDDVSLLHEKEDHYLKLYWGDPMLLNRAKSSRGGFERTPDEIEKHRAGAFRSAGAPKRSAALSVAFKKKCKEDPEYIKRLHSFCKRNKVAAFKNGQYIQTFDSYSDAEREYGIGRGRVAKVAQGMEKTAMGYSFKDVGDNGEFIEPKKFPSFGHSGGKPVKIQVLDKYGVNLFMCDTITEACNRTGVHMGTLHKVCIGKQKTANGYIFQRME